ncbi:MAG: ABC transporter permease [Deltaproteobacteria bacterium]|nr:ABC transporter permease [Deltaproteobacteria bacterium]
MASPELPPDVARQLRRAKVEVAVGLVLLTAGGAGVWTLPIFAAPLVVAPGILLLAMAASRRMSAGHILRHLGGFGLQHHGPLPVVHGILAILCIASFIGIAAAWPVLWRHSLTQPDQLWWGAIGFGALLGTTMILAVLSYFRARRVQPGTRGRGRLLFRPVISVAALLFALIPLAIFYYGASKAFETGFAFSYTHDEAYYALPLLLRTGLLVSGIVAVVVLLIDLGLAISTWFLLPERFRFWFWIVWDVTVTVAAVYVIATLPLKPEEDGNLEQIARSGVRLGTTALAVLRYSIRAIPPVMKALGLLSFELTVATRHLSSKKSGFLAAIGGLSILAVSVSTCMLTAVLSVMGGFRDDLKQKILGNQAHIVVDQEEERPFEGWDDLLGRIETVDGVRGATPFVRGEVMVSSTSNRAGAVLRGIDPDSVEEVTDLVDNITNGRMLYLREPHRLLDLPPEERRSILPLDFGTSLGAANDEDDEGSPRVEVVDEDDEPIEDLDEFLLEDEPSRRSPDDPDTLPGIIVGKELARTLRLFVGDELDVVSPLGDLGPAGPMPKARRFRVAAIFYSGMYEYDMKMAYVLLDDAQRFLGTGGAISGIEVKTRDVDRAPEIALAIERELEEGTPHRSELRVQDWQELNKNLFGALELEKLAMFVTLGIAILIAGFCVFGTLTLMVQEKGREVGILKAMGTRASEVVRIFLWEGLLIGIYGALMGLGMGYLVVFVLEHFGIRLNPEVYYIDRLPVHTDPMEFVIVGISAVVVCLLATLFPAYLASRMRPVDALRQL